MAIKKIMEYPKWVFSKIWYCVSIPFLTYWSRKNLVRSFLWIVFTVGLSLIGTIINVIKIAFFEISTPATSISFIDKIAYSIYLDSRSGTFYTFSIVMAASTLYPLFVGFVRHNFHYVNLRVLAIIGALLLLAFGGVFYSFSSIKEQEIIAITKFEPCLDIYQFTFFVVAICISSYSFSLGLMMDEHEQNPHPEIDDYDLVEKDAQKLEELEREAEKKKPAYNNIQIDM